MPGDFTDGNGELCTAHIVLTLHSADKHVSELLMLAGWKFAQALSCIVKMWMCRCCLCMTNSRRLFNFRDMACAHASTGACACLLQMKCMILQAWVESQSTE